MILTGDRERMEAIIDVSALRLEPAGVKLVRLLELLIEDMRKQNDTVSKDGLERNQGKIAGWEQLKEYVTKGLPGPKLGERPKPAGTY